MPCALHPMPFAHTLCTLPLALCPMPFLPYALCPVLFLYHLPESNLIDDVNT